MVTLSAAIVICNGANLHPFSNTAGFMSRWELFRVAGSVGQRAFERACPPRGPIAHHGHAGEPAVNFNLVLFEVAAPQLVALTHMHRQMDFS